jgi:hypothetical protein
MSAGLEFKTFFRFEPFSCEHKSSNNKDKVPGERFYMYRDGNKELHNHLQFLNDNASNNVMKIKMKKIIINVVQIERHIKIKCQPSKKVE